MVHQLFCAIVPCTPVAGGTPVVLLRENRDKNGEEPLATSGPLEHFLLGVDPRVKIIID